MKKIVVAIDFDEEVNDVLDAVCELAAGLDAELYVVHIYPPTPAATKTPYVFPNAPSSESVVDHEEELQSQKRQIRKIVGKLHKKNLKASGYMKPADRHIGKAILDFADEIKAELLVLGTHRPGRIERIILGSVAEEVFRKTSIPTLVIPRQKAES